MQRSHIKSGLLRSIFLVGAVLFLNSCGGGGSGDGGAPEVAPTTSALVSSRSPDNNDINVSSNIDITITADPSLLTDTLLFTVWDLGQNENCFFTWGGLNCPYATAPRSFEAPTIQGNTATLKSNPRVPLSPDTNYLIVLSNDFTDSADDDFLLYWKIRTKPAGVFLDSPVINIGYRTESSEGVTNARGEYEYLPGESVTFFIADLVFPTVPAKGTVTPLDLAGTTDINDPKVVNMIRFLQTLDMFKDPLTNITISDFVKPFITPVDFSLSVSDFENSKPIKDLIASVSNSNLGFKNLVTTASAKSNFQRQLDALEKLKFNASTLPGKYDVVADNVAGTQQLTFNADGSVDIVWSDGSEEILSWSVNSKGQLLLSGSTSSDTLTLTSGSQSSGKLDLVLDDEDGLVNSPGTIKLTAGLTTTFDGSYNFTATSTTPFNSLNFPCENASGVMSIENSTGTGSVTGTPSGGTASISGIVQPDGSLSSVDLADSVYSIDVTGKISGTSGSGTWDEPFGCAGTWAMTKN